MKKHPLGFASFAPPIAPRIPHRTGELEGVEFAPKDMGGYYVRLYMGKTPTIFGWTHDIEDACRLADIMTYLIRPMNYRYNYSLEQVKKDLDGDHSPWRIAVRRLDWDKIFFGFSILEYD